MMANMSGRQIIQAKRVIGGHRYRAGLRIKRLGTPWVIIHQPQAGAFSYPAKCVDAQTRALIEAAIQERRA